MASCWGLTSGNAGMMAQARALALAMGLTPVMKTVQLRPSLAWLPNRIVAPLGSFMVPCFLDSKSDMLLPRYPDVVISCGRRAAMVAMGLRRAVPRTTQFIHIQDPHVSARYFDVVVAMEHDKISGPNVVKTRYALHSISDENLREAAAQFAPRFASYAKPYIAVLLGGSTNKYTLSGNTMAKIIADLQELLQTTQGSLLITPSRRTGENNIAMLKESFAGNSRVYIYDFVEPNPYMGLLGLADFIVVSNDSVNMMSEARATGKPIYILPLPGHANTKPAEFSERLLLEGVARPMGNLEPWSYSVSNEMETLAQQVNRLLAN